MRRFTASTRSGCALGTVAVLSAGAGCASSHQGVRTVTIDEFAQREAADIVEAPAALEGVEAPEGGAVQPVVARARGDAAGLDPFGFADVDDFPARSILRPTEPGETVVVDSLVGHINGRPLFADDFLEPIEDRLMRAAEETSGVEQQQVFRVIIRGWLEDVVTNELLLAEAEASLSVEEQRGLFAWLRMMYDEEIRRGGGTRSGAEQRRERAGEDLDQFLGDQKDMVLIHQIRQNRIHPRVIVSWRDIEREYQRRYEEFNPPATVTLARIRLNANTQAALVDTVTSQLAAGEPFAEIAEELGFADGGVWETFEMGPGGITDIEVSAPMKQALQGLEAGETSQPVKLGSTLLWLHVVEVQRDPPRSIYEPSVQIGLRNAIQARRANDEWFRFVNSLLERGVYDELEDMGERLYQIALHRYGR